MRKLFLIHILFLVSHFSQAQNFIKGSIKNNADPAKLDIFLKPNYSNGSGEYCFFFQFATSLPASLAGSITATAIGANTFSNMGTLNPISPFTETFGTPSAADDERVFGWFFADTNASTQSWSNGTEFIGAVVTFSANIAGIEIKMLDLINLNGGGNTNTYFYIVTNLGDITNYDSLFYAKPGFSQLGNYFSGDQYVKTSLSSCSGSISGTAAGSATFCGSGTPVITASGYSTGAGSGYQWMSATSSLDYPSLGTPVPGQTNPDVLTTGVVTTTTYYWLKVTCTSGIAVAYSNMITITINSLPAVTCPANTSVLANAAAFALTGGSPAGGTFSGPGVSNGNFDPAVAGLGVKTITYSYNNIITGCSNSCNFTITVQPQSNDEASGAILLTVGAGCSGSPYSNIGATQSASETYPACVGTAGYKTVWYKFAAPASGNVRVSTDYSGGTMGNDSRIALFSAANVNDYSTFTSLACDDDNGSVVSARSVLYATGLTPGNIYYIQVDGKNGSTAEGTFCLTVDEMTSLMIATSTSCAPGQPLALINDNYTGFLSATDANSKLVAMISNPAGGVATSTSTYDNALNINAGTVRQDANDGYYHDRNITISNSAVSNVNVQFFFLNTELAALQAVDPDVTLANLQATRQTGSTCDNNFVVANGTNTSIEQTGNGSGIGFSWIRLQTPGFSKFYLHTKRAFVPLKTLLQGAYTSGPLHKPVTTTWAAVLNANALTQPYNVTGFGYTGTESVNSGFFASTASTTDIVDWVLVEIRNAVTPSTVITRRAAFIREDGLIKDLNGTSDLSFRTLTNNNYHVVIRHRNHLAIRTASTMALDGTLGYSPGLKNFSTAQEQAYQNPAVTANAAQKNLSSTIFGMWGGNGNSDNAVRASGPPASNDYIFLITTTLGGNVTQILSNVYNGADMNLDGAVRASGTISINDYLFLVTTVLGGNATKIYTGHQ